MSKSRIIRAAHVTMSDKKLRLNDPNPESGDTAESLVDDAILSREREFEEVSALKEQIIAEANKEASLITKAARAESSRMITEAEAEATRKKHEIAEESRKQGYEEGIKAGRAEGNQLRKEASAVLDEARKTREAMINRLEPELVELAIGIAEKLLRDRAAFNPNTVLCLVKAGLSESAASQEIKIRVSADDYTAVTDNRDELLKLVEGGAKLDIVKDMSLNKSDCIIETDFGYIDSSLDQQMTALKENLYYLTTHED